MRILVLVKQVPEVSELRLDPETRRLDRAHAGTLMNPFDRRAMLEAHRLRAEHGGTIAAVTMGPPQAETILRECLGLGADRVVHLCGREFAGADTLATARALSRAADRIGYDVILAGRYSIDSETGQVGPEIASLLGVPFLGGVRRLELDTAHGEVRYSAECEGDDGFVECTGAAPIVLTCTDRWATRIPRVLPDEDKTNLGEVEVWGVGELGGEIEDYGQPGSPTWVEEVRAVPSQRDRELLHHGERGSEAIDRLSQRIGASRVEATGRAALSMPGHAVAGACDQWILVLGERGPDGSVRAVTWELVGEADRLATRVGGNVALLLLDPRLPPDAVRDELNPDREAGEAGARGADRILVAPIEADPVETIAAAFEALGPRIVLGAATAVGRDLIPQVAARFSLGLTGDAIGLELDAEGRLHQLKPAFGGQVVAPILSRTRPEMVTLRPGVLEPCARDDARGSASVEMLAVGGPPMAGPVCSRFEAEVSAEAAAIEEARVVVCAGYGLGEEGVEEAARLAHRLGGVLAGTRRVCDLKWLPRQSQIGLSGRHVAPDLYLGLGVRGSFNHTVGLRRAHTIIAVNSDPEAEFFEGADLGIVGDARVVVAELLARLDETVD